MRKCRPLAAEQNERPCRRAARSTTRGPTAPSADAPRRSSTRARRRWPAPPSTASSARKNALRPSSRRWMASPPIANRAAPLPRAARRQHQHRGGQRRHACRSASAPATSAARARRRRVPAIIAAADRSSSVPGVTVCLPPPTGSAASSAASAAKMSASGAASSTRRRSAPSVSAALRLGEQLEMGARRRRDEEQQSRDGYAVRGRLAHRQRVAQEARGPGCPPRVQGRPACADAEARAATDGRPDDAARGTHPLRQELPHGRCGAGQAAHHAAPRRFTHSAAADVAPDAAACAAAARARLTREGGASGARKPTLEASPRSAAQAATCRAVEQQPSAVGHVRQALVADPDLRSTDSSTPKRFRELDDVQIHPGASFALGRSITVDVSLGGSLCGSYAIEKRPCSDGRARGVAGARRQRSLRREEALMTILGVLGMIGCVAWSIVCASSYVGHMDTGDQAGFALGMLFLVTIGIPITGTLLAAGAAGEEAPRRTAIVNAALAGSLASGRCSSSPVRRSTTVSSSLRSGPAPRRSSTRATC